MKLSVIIPCYNEADRILPTLHRIHTYLTGQNYTFEILVVDNGSTDDTKKIVEEVTKRMPELRLTSHKSYGKGWAVKQGMLEAKGDFRLFTDADNSTDIEHVAHMIMIVESGYDIVISSRRVDGAVIIHKQAWPRQLLGNTFAGLVRLIIPLGIKDTQNGFKLFSAKAAQDLFSRQRIYFWAFDVEILVLAKKHGYKIKEVPITWINDDQSKMNVKGMIGMLREIIMIRLLL
jgi:dolichyl-phosphate beta-glucosyltransferase